jgi:HEAT repeat protein
MDIHQLIELLRSGTPPSRREAAEVLGALKPAEGLAPLIALLSDSEEPLRITAILTLGRYNHPQAVAALIRLVLALRTIDADFH